jgi:hypothetical protein
MPIAFSAKSLAVAHEGCCAGCWFCESWGATFWSLELFPIGSSHTVPPLEWNVGEFFFLNLFLLLELMKDLGSGGSLGLPLKHMSGL